MSYLTLSRPSNIQNLTNKELNDLIKFNEYYSSCYSVVQERNLRAIDILNLSEHSLAAWKLPLWLTKKLLSLKETLTNNPESLFIQEENDDPRKTISDTLTNLFKNKQKPKLPSKKSISGNSPTSIESEVDLIYDEDNYLRAQFNSSSKRPINSPNREQPKPPNRKGQDLPFIATRKPVALPRPDEEENEYEPPPKHRSKFDKATTKLPLPPPPAEETDEYEPPPRFKEKQTESVQEEDYEYIETKKEKKDENNGNQRSKFYIDAHNEFPPPLPERSFIPKLERKKKKWAFLPVYSNVTDMQSSTGKTSNPTQNRTRKITPKASKPISPFPVDAKSSDSKTAWSVLSRPLPPLPKAPGDQSSLSSPDNAESENVNEETEYANTKDGTTEAENLADYGNLPEPTPTNQTGNPGLKLNKSKEHLDDLRTHLSNFKLRSSNSLRPGESSFEESRQLQEKFQKKHLNREKEMVLNDNKSKTEIALLKSKMKLPLPPSSLPQNVQTPYFDTVADDTESESNDFRRSPDSADDEENSVPPKDEPEYLNTTDTKNEPYPLQSQFHLKSPKNEPALEITQRKLRSVTSRRHLEGHKGFLRNPIVHKEDKAITKEGSERDFENDEEDNLPEYINNPEYRNEDVKTLELKANGHHTQSAISLASQIMEVKLKATPRNDINLNDKLADELRMLLESRREHVEDSATDSNVKSNNTRKISSTKLAPKPSFNINNTDREEVDEIEQEEYDVPGALDIFNFNNEPYYRNTDRKGAIALLKDLEDGAFLLRPSSKFFLSITIKNNGKYFNLGIEKTANNTIFCGEGMMRTKEFFSLQKFLEHFEINPLTVQGETGLEEVYLKKVLPADRF